MSPAPDKTGYIKICNMAALLFGILLCVCVMPRPGAALPVAVDQVRGSLSLKNSAFYLVDPAGVLDIAEVSAPLRQNQFMPLKDGIPKNSGGVLWLRFSLIKNNLPADASRSNGNNKLTLSLELGSATPQARMFVAETISAEGEVQQWREHASSMDGSFDLPDPVLLPLTVYVRVNSMPTFWFDPQIVNPTNNEPSTFPWRLVLRILLGLALAVTLVRGMSENEEWRFWAGAILACVAIFTLYGDGGAEKNIIYLYSMPQLLTPGLAVMLMPHLGRYMLGSHKSRPLDFTLIALSLPGVAAALLPLIPGMGWTARALPLAPLLLIPLLPLAISAIRKKQSGSLCFFLFVLFPVAGALIAVYSLYAPQVKSLYLLGVHLPALGYLAGGILMAVAKPAARREKNDFFPLGSYLEHGNILSEAKDAEQSGALFPNADSHGKNTAGTAAAMGKQKTETDGEELPDYLQIHPKDKENNEDILELGPSLQIAAQTTNSSIEPVQSAPDSVNSTVESMAQLASLFTMEDTHNFQEPARTDGQKAKTASLEKEVELFPDATALSEAARSGENVIYIKDEEEPGLVIIKAADPSSPLPDVSSSLTPALFSEPGVLLDHKAIGRVENALRAPYENLLLQLNELRQHQDGSAELADNLEESIGALGLMLDNLDKVARGEHPGVTPTQSIFNLAVLVRHVHEIMLPLAEQKGITLSWFVAPGLPAFFKGHAENLSNALQFLLQGSMEAADSGAVQLTVREAPERDGKVQFSLLESGMSIKNLRRPSGWLNKAWELASTSGGSFNIDFIPDKGTGITFSMALTPIWREANASSPVPGESAGSSAQNQNLEQGLIPNQNGAFNESEEPQKSADMNTLNPTPATPQTTSMPEPEVAPLPEYVPEIPQVEDAPLREYIIIADMAASGRRLIARRLDGLPCKVIEAGNAREVIDACAAYPVGLIIFDADMPELDMRKAIQTVSASQRDRNLPVIPSLCLIAHSSQAERMARLGCRESQLKSASRTQFRQTVLALCPHPNADPAELLPESPLLRGHSEENPNMHEPAGAGSVKNTSAGEKSAAPEKQNVAKKGERVPMLDLIVASLDHDDASPSQPGGMPAEKTGTPENLAKKTFLPEEHRLESPYKIAQSDDYMDADMVPLIPGFLIVLEDTLSDLERARREKRMELTREISARMAGQGGTYGLIPLERMARCVERAAEADDEEAVNDLSEELLSLGRRYLFNLKATHEEYLKINK